MHSGLGPIRVAPCTDCCPSGSGIRGFLGQSIEVEKRTRRQFFGAAAGVVGAVALYEVLAGESSPQRGSATTTAPVLTLDEPTPAQSFITPNSDFFRIDVAYPGTPEVVADSWRLKIHGLVDREVELTMDDLARFEQVTNTITLACVSNNVGGSEIGTAEWGGVLLADVLREAGVQPGAEQLVSKSHDGWTCGTPVDAVMDGRAAMLVTSMNGEPLSAEHGYPVRMVIPGLFGYVSATKWLTDIELTTWDAFDAYWVQAGWTKEGPVITSSRVDVPRPGARVAAGPINFAGFAWAPQAGVGSVQVRVDDSEWTDTELLRGPNGDSWAQWTTKFDVSAGEHVVTVRTVDVNGNAQIEAVQGTFPSGATGLHSVKFTAI